MKKVDKDMQWFSRMNFILFTGTFIHSAGLFLLNAFLPWEDAGLKEYNGVSLGFIRILIRKNLDTFSGIIVLVYFVGMLFLLRKLYLKRALPDVKWIVKNFIIVILGVSVCIFPFSLLDRAFMMDYVYPVISALSSVMLLLLIVCILNYRMSVFKRTHKEIR